MDDIERLAQQFSFNNERYVCLACALCAGNDADAVASECSEQFARNAWSVLHVFSNDSYGCQLALQFHLIHGSHLYFFGKLLVEHLTGTFGIFIAHADRGAVFRTGLADEENAYAVGGESGEDALIDTYYAYHGESAHSDERGVVDG